MKTATLRMPVWCPPRMDSDVGKLLDELKKLGIDKNTLVIFTSDNGHEYDTGFFDSNGDFKGHKRDLYDGGIRIPFIARWPGKIEAGSTTDHISAFWDFLPTACDIAGISPSEDNLDGISYLPTLLGQDGQQKEHDYLYWEFNEGKGPIQAIRKGEFKAIKYLGQPVEIYNIIDDRGEEQNLAKEMPELAQEMGALIKNARTENEDFKLQILPHPNKR